jgi:NAD dependent epimerase/dehydratase
MNPWSDGPVLVTGAGGFIGSHLTEQLVCRGERVRAFVRYNSRSDRGLLELLPPSILDSVEVVFGDLRDADRVRRAAKGVSAIFHLGAHIGIPYSYTSPRDVVETNVVGTLNVLEAAREQEVERFLHTSTSEVYGTARHVPMDETHPLTAQSPYAGSKIGADKLVESFHLSFGLQATIVRPFNTYGPRQSNRAVIPTIVTQALTGGELRLGSLDPTRDWTFVTDTATAFIAIAEEEATIGETLNLGTGTETSIREVVAIVGRLVGRDLTVQTDSQRIRPTASEVQRLVSDNSRCRQLCGWHPIVSMEEGLGNTVAWMRHQLGRYRTAEYAV